MGQKHQTFREFRQPFPRTTSAKKSSQHERACTAHNGAICSKSRKIVPYHRDSPNTRNGARLRSPSPIMAPDSIQQIQTLREYITAQVVLWAKPRGKRVLYSREKSSKAAENNVPSFGGHIAISDDAITDLVLRLLLGLVTRLLTCSVPVLLLFLSAVHGFKGDN